MEDSARGPAGDSPPRRADRLLAFTDAVAAIAATLLVLPLVEIVPAAGDQDVGQLLSENGNAFLAFVLSFVVIYRFWVLHHRMFSSRARLTAALMWLNGLWLLSIVFLPFPTQLVGTQDAHDRLAWALYIGTILTTSASSMAIVWLLRREPAAVGRESVMRLVAFTAALVVALVLAVTIPGAGPWSLLLLVPTGMVNRWLRRRAPA